MTKRLQSLETENKQLVDQLSLKEHETIKATEVASIQDLMQEALAKQESRIAELAVKETCLRLETETLEKQRAKQENQEKSLTKLQMVNEGTTQKLKIRKEELDKEWSRLDQIRVDLYEREGRLETERVTLTAERELVATEK